MNRIMSNGLVVLKNNNFENVFPVESHVRLSPAVADILDFFSIMTLQGTI
jgi:hypothetical protein